MRFVRQAIPDFPWEQIPWEQIPWKLVAVLVAGSAMLLLACVVYLLMLMIRAVSRGGGQIRTRFLTFTIPTASSPEAARKSATEPTSTDRSATPLAEELWSFRQKRKVTQGDLAKLLNVTVTFISRVEFGRSSNPPPT